MVNFFSSWSVLNFSPGCEKLPFSRKDRLMSRFPAKSLDSQLSLLQKLLPLVLPQSAAWKNTSVYFSPESNTVQTLLDDYKPLCRAREEVSNNHKPWSVQVDAVKNALLFPNNTKLLHRLSKWGCSKDVSKLNLDQYSKEEISLIIYRLCSVYKQTLEDFKMKKKSNNGVFSTSSDFARVKEISAAVFDIFEKLLWAHDRQILQLYTSDLQYMVEFYYLAQKPKLANELLAKCTYLNNKLWYFNINIQCDTNIQQSQLLSQKVKAGYSRNFQTGRDRYDDSKAENLFQLYNKSGLPVDTHINSSFIRAFGKVGNLNRVNEIVKSTHSKHLNNEYLFSIMLAYAQNGDFVTGLSLCLSLLDSSKRMVTITPNLLKQFWLDVLRMAGTFTTEFSNTPSKDTDPLVASNKADDVLDTTKYELFDLIAQQALANLKAQNIPLNTRLFNIILSNSSADLIESLLPEVYAKSIDSKSNSSRSELENHQVLFHKWVSFLIKYYALESDFSKAEFLLQNYPPVDTQLQNQLYNLIKSHQDHYAMSMVQQGKQKRKLLDDDDDDW